MPERAFSAFKLLGLLFVAFGIFVFVGRSSLCSHQGSSNKKSRHLTHSSLLDAHWLPFDRFASRKIANKRPRSAKVIIEVTLPSGESRILVARKKTHIKRHRSRLRKKHGRLEFPGGRLDRGEDPLQALLRELEEEDDTQILAKAFNRIRKNKPGQLYYRCIKIKRKEEHLILRMPLAYDSWLKLDHAWSRGIRNDEVYSYHLAPVRDVGVKKVDGYVWTSKTKRIVRALVKSSK